MGMDQPLMHSINNQIHGVLTKKIYIIKSSIQIMHGCESEKLNYGVGL